MRGARACLLLAGLAFGQPALAQEGEAAIPATPPAQAPAASGPVRSPILTIDPERLFTGSLYGQRVSERLNAESEALAAENRSIEADLTEEEQSLTDRRPSMTVDQFRRAADAFDARVQEIRREQDAKERALQQIVQQGQEAFREAVRPILGELMQERGAAVLLDRRSVVLGVGAIDITDEAIARIDGEIGAGPDPAE